MSKQVIVLTTNSNTTPGFIVVNYILWLTTAAPVVNNSRGSSYNLASAPELAAIQAGTTVEEQYTQQFPVSLATAEIKLFLQAHYTSRQNYWNSVPGPSAYNGVFFDSVTGWSA